MDGRTGSAAARPVTCPAPAPPATSTLAVDTCSRMPFTTMARSRRVSSKSPRGLLRGAGDGAELEPGSTAHPYPSPRAPVVGHRHLAKAAAALHQLDGCAAQPIGQAAAGGEGERVGDETHARLHSPAARMADRQPDKRLQLLEHLGRHHGRVHNAAGELALHQGGAGGGGAGVWAGHMRTPWRWPAGVPQRALSAPITASAIS